MLIEYLGQPLSDMSKNVNMLHSFKIKNERKSYTITTVNQN